MIRSAGNRPYAPVTRRPATPVKAGGGTPQPAPSQPAPPSAGAFVQQLMLTLQAAFSAIAGWLRRLFQPAAPSQPGTPSYLGPQQPVPSGNPVAQALMPLPGMASQRAAVTGGVGLTRVDGQAAVGGRVEARTGDTYVSGDAAVTRTADGMAATVGARVTSPKVQGAIAGVVSKDSATVAGALAARVGKDGSLQAAGLYQQGPEGVRANAQASYQDPSTAAGLRYTQENERRSVGGFVDRRLPHSSLSLGADYLWSPEGDGGRAYGRWQSDAIGERVGGFAVRGGLEAGAVKLPGQDWSTYAVGRLTAERDNAALFTEISHQAGPGFAQPDTSLKFGAQFRF